MIIIGNKKDGSIDEFIEKSKKVREDWKEPNKPDMLICIDGYFEEINGKMEKLTCKKPMVLVDVKTRIDIHKIFEKDSSLGFISSDESFPKNMFITNRPSEYKTGDFILCRYDELMI